MQLVWALPPTCYDRAKIRGTFTRLRIDMRGYVRYVGVMELFHADIRLPEGFVAPTARVPLSWTRHAHEARWNDRVYHNEIPAFDTLPLSRFSVVEVGVESGRVVKMVVRGHFTKTHDLVFVLIPGPRWTVKTVWSNLRTDVHRTLDKSRYVQ